MGKASVPPGFESFPVGYAGRCSSIRVSQAGDCLNRERKADAVDCGQGVSGGITRPWGQYWVAEEGGSKKIVFDESRMVDFELEVGCIIGSGSSATTGDGRGGRSPVKIEDALDRIFGFVLVNDWSGK